MDWFIEEKYNAEPAVIGGLANTNEQPSKPRSTTAMAAPIPSLWEAPAADDFQRHSHDEPLLPNALPSSSMMHRSLQLRGEGTNGPVWVLIIVCVLFCFIWTPIIFQRRCRRSSRQRDQAEDFIRVSLQNLNMLATLEQRATAAALDASAAFAANGGHFNGAFRSNPEERREFVKNMLVTKKIVKISSVTNKDSNNNSSTHSSSSSSRTATATNDDDDKSKSQKTTPKNNTEPTQYKLIVSDIATSNENTTTTTKTTTEPCVICLNDYTTSSKHDENLISYAQSNKCQHIFHTNCIQEWLMKHDECPCCRHNFFAFDDDDDIENDNNNNRVMHSTSIWLGHPPRSSSSLRQQQRHQRSNRTTADDIELPNLGVSSGTDSNNNASNNNDAADENVVRNESVSNVDDDDDDDDAETQQQIVSLLSHLSQLAMQVRQAAAVNATEGTTDVDDRVSTSNSDDDGDGGDEEEQQIIAEEGEAIIPEGCDVEAADAVETAGNDEQIQSEITSAATDDDAENPN